MRKRSILSLVWKKERRGLLSDRPVGPKRRKGGRKEKKDDVQGKTFSRWVLNEGVKKKLA